MDNNYDKTTGSNDYLEEGNETAEHASFWERLVAYLIDSLIIGIPVAAVTFIIFLVMLGGSLEMAEIFNDHAFLESEPEFSDAEGFLVLMFFLKYVFISAGLSFVVTWLYFALFHSSKWQATLGKKLLNIKVTNMSGERISFGRATGRFLVKNFLSPILLIGFILAAITEKKQSLHDIIAKTIVLKD